MIKIDRKYLEIKSLEDLVESKNPSENFSIKLDNFKDFQLQKFFYKQVGQKHGWNDRLLWSDQKWINYISKKNLYTYILKDREDLAGFFEIIHHKEIKEAEIAYFGLLEEYIGKKIGGYMLTEAIKLCFKFKVKRVYLFTSSLDHKNALNNYLSRGMKIYQKDEFKTKIA